MQERSISRWLLACSLEVADAWSLEVADAWSLKVAEAWLTTSEDLFRFARVSAWSRTRAGSLWLGRWMSSEGLVLVFKVPARDNIWEFEKFLPVGVTGSLLALFFLSLEGIL